MVYAIAHSMAHCLRRHRQQGRTEYARGLAHGCHDFSRTMQACRLPRSGRSHPERLSFMNPVRILQIVPLGQILNADAVRAGDTRERIARSNGVIFFRASGRAWCGRRLGAS